MQSSCLFLTAIRSVVLNTPYSRYSRLIFSFPLQELVPSSVMARRTHDSLQNELDSIQSQISTLSSRYSDVQRILDDMTRLRDVLYSDIEDLKRAHKDLEAQRFPIHWLPSEILAVIFQIVAEPWSLSQCLKRPEPFFTPPFKLAQVCASWRRLAISTPSLWSFMLIRHPKSHHPAFLEYRERAGSVVPLDVVYATPINTHGDTKEGLAQDLIADIRPFVHRLRSFAVSTLTVFEIAKFIEWVNDLQEWPMLDSLELHRNWTTNPIPVPLLPAATRTRFRKLHTLNLHWVPIQSLDFGLQLTSLEHLTLSYPKSPDRSPSPSFTVYALCSLLAKTPNLETLSLIDCVPIFDVVANFPHIRTHDVHSGRKAISPVSLPRLHRINWGWPTRRTVMRLFEFLAIPSIEKLELYIEASGNSHHGVNVVSPRAADVSSFVFQSLREITYHVEEDDFTGSFLRRCSLPSLETLEIANVSRASKRRAKVDQVPNLPKIDSIFWDPRLIRLTHLTLSRYQFANDHKSETMFGYMCALTSLTLEKCSGLRYVFRALQERTSGGVTLMSGNANAKAALPTTRVLKAAPRLQSLSLWTCKDFTFNDLLDLVQTRNLLGITQVPSTMQMSHNPASDRRLIKPLRKTKLSPLPAGEDTRPFTPVASSQLTYIRLDGIVSVSESQAQSLMNSGVLEVLWTEAGI
ncbi:hypothetical protein DL96DRAFT_1108934 [Flagelloscypha sp. PMI_526]|nr:hypothetical protein DL96DRAFT_1108934 [Flagelloscypha sp. PMI_526]